MFTTWNQVTGYLETIPSLKHLLCKQEATDLTTGAATGSQYPQIKGESPREPWGHSYIWVRSPTIVTDSVNRAFFLWQRTQRLSTEGHCGQTMLTELVNQATATKKETFSAVTKQEKIEIPVVWCGIPVARINFHSSQKPKQQVTWLLRLINVFFAFLQA